MCEHPVLIVNPTAQRLWNKAHYYVSCGNICDFISLSEMKTLCGYFNNGLRETDPEKIDRIVNENYIVVYGYRVNCFISAPCRRCRFCVESRRKEIEARCLFEASDYPNMWFFTLTYSDSHLVDCGLFPRHVSEFNKRFRENLAKWYSKTFNVDLVQARSATFYRCLYVGEYGSRTRRPHYHGIFFFKNPIPDKYAHDVYKVFHRSWDNGYIDDFQKIHTPAAAARYVTKYITKSYFTDVPKGKNPCFIRGPHKIGLGASRLGYYLQDIINSRDNTIRLNINGVVVRVMIPKFLRDKVFSNPLRKFGCLSDVFYEYERLKDEMNYRRSVDPFSFCLDPSDFVDVFNDKEYLRFGLRCECSQKYKDSIIDACGSFCLESVFNYYRSFTDDALNKQFMYCVDFLSKLPLEDEFFSFLRPQLDWQNNLSLPTLSYEEKCIRNQTMYLKNVNYVQKRMMDENFDLSLCSC